MSIEALYQTEFAQTPLPDNLAGTEAFCRRPTAYSKHWWTEVDLPWEELAKALGCALGNPDSVKA